MPYDYQPKYVSRPPTSPGPTRPIPLSNGPSRNAAPHGVIDASPRCGDPSSLTETNCDGLQGYGLQAPRSHRPQGLGVSRVGTGGEIGRDGALAPPGAFPADLAVSASRTEVGSRSAVPYKAIPSRISSSKLSRSVSSCTGGPDSRQSATCRRWPSPFLFGPAHTC